MRLRFDPDRETKPDLAEYLGEAFSKYRAPPCRARFRIVDAELSAQYGRLRQLITASSQA